MSEEPRENPKLRMDENIKNQKMKRSSPFIFWRIFYPFLKNKNRGNRNGNRRNKRTNRKQEI